MGVGDWHIALAISGFFALVCGMAGLGFLAVDRFALVLQIMIVLPALLIPHFLLWLRYTSATWMAWLEPLHPISWIWWFLWLTALALSIGLYRFCCWLMLQTFFVPFAKPDDRAMAFWIWALALSLGFVSMHGTFLKIVFFRSS